MPDSQSENVNISSLKIRWLNGVLLFFLIYATLRYNVFKGVYAIHFPLYIVNKVVSVSGILFLALSYAFGKISWLKIKDKQKKVQFVKFTGLVGFSLIAMHVFMSLSILSPSYYAKFYDQGMMNFTGEMSMVMGVFSLYCFSIPAITTIPFMQEAVGIKRWQKGQKMGYLGLLTSLLHTGFMGFSGWFDIDNWPGYMPPLSLIATILAFIPLYLKLLKSAPSDRDN